MKNWLTERFLPLWAKETILRDNRLLQEENDRLRQENDRLRACIRGIRLGLRAAKQGGKL